MTWRDAHRAAAAAADAAAPGKPQKPTLKRFSWCRWHHELTYSPLWTLVAQRAGVLQPVVEAFVQRLEVYASANVPRGSLEGFNVAALAAAWRTDEDALGRIYVQLERPDVGWIEQDHIVTFWARNPDQEDRTAGERQQRKRDRAKGMRWLAGAARRGEISADERRTLEIELHASPNPRELSTGWERHGASRRDDRDVTTRAEQIDKGRGPAEEERRGRDSSPSNTTDAAHRNSGDNGDNSGDVEVWLAFEGKRIVAERCKALPSRAWLDIGRWRKELGDDIAALAAMISDADVMGLTGGKFADRIREQILRYRYETKGPPLPLPPAIARRREHG